MLALVVLSLVYQGAMLVQGSMLALVVQVLVYQGSMGQTRGHESDQGPMLLVVLSLVYL